MKKDRKIRVRGSDCLTRNEVPGSPFDLKRSVWSNARRIGVNTSICRNERTAVKVVPIWQEHPGRRAKGGCRQRSIAESG